MTIIRYALVHYRCPAFTTGHRPDAQLVVKPGNGRPHTLEEWGLCSTQRSISFFMGLLPMMPEIWGLANNIDNDQASC